MALQNRLLGANPAFTIEDGVASATATLFSLYFASTHPELTQGAIVLQTLVPSVITAIIVERALSYYLKRETKGIRRTYFNFAQNNNDLIEPNQYVGGQILNISKVAPEFYRVQTMEGWSETGAVQLSELLHRRAHVVMN